MTGDKIVWVDENISRSLSGWFTVDYEIMNKDGHFYFQHKMFDTLKDAKQFIKECKKEIKEFNKDVGRAYKYIIG